jgi:hypothetical protein
MPLTEKVPHVVGEATSDTAVFSFADEPVQSVPSAVCIRRRHSHMTWKALHLSTQLLDNAAAEGS